MAFPLLVSVFVIATCGLIYELIAGALASYLLGDSVTQFSTIIGTYLFAMGIGSYFSKFFQRNLVSHFIRVEILIGLVGGCSAAILFVLFESVVSFRIVLYGLVTLTGILVGLEIPLLMRILKERFEFKDLVAKVFTFDYVGALFASLLFPLVLVPHLGFIRSGFLFGALNVGVALWTIFLFRQDVMWVRMTKSAAIASLLFLVTGFALSDKIQSFAETAAYADRVVFAKSTPYQRIIVTQSDDDLRLFLNGNLQFSSRDEYRYHEALVHVGLASLPQAKHILVLGGGDGLAVRELLRYPNIESIQLVDLDTEMIRLFRDTDRFAALNSNSLRSPKVKVTNADAFRWIREAREKYDFIVVDFPDPSNFSLGKLYSTTFYAELSKVLSDDGALVIQSTSPYVARKSFWCVAETLESVGFVAQPYHVYVPSFGEWGYVLASKKTISAPASLPEGLRFVTLESWASYFEFPPDMARVKTDVNRLNNQMLVRYFDDEWSHYVH